jgi:hypothetical protein
MVFLIWQYNRTLSGWGGAAALFLSAKMNG